MYEYFFFFCEIAIAKLRFTLALLVDIFLLGFFLIFVLYLYFAVWNNFQTMNSVEHFEMTPVNVSSYSQSS